MNEFDKRMRMATRKEVVEQLRAGDFIINGERIRLAKDSRTVTKATFDFLLRTGVIFKMRTNKIYGWDEYGWTEFK